MEIPRGSHNQTVHPSGKYMYNSNNELLRGPGFLEYFDITNLTAPKKLGELPLETGIDSHDLTFNADGSRAYSAAITHTLIINTEDPSKPSLAIASLAMSENTAFGIFAIGFGIVVLLGAPLFLEKSESSIRNSKVFRGHGQGGRWTTWNRSIIYLVGTLTVLLGLAALLGLLPS